jgi:hypothetical protein
MIGNSQHQKKKKKKKEISNNRKKKNIKWIEIKNQKKVFECMYLHLAMWDFKHHHSAL